MRVYSKTFIAIFRPNRNFRISSYKAGYSVWQVCVTCYFLSASVKLLKATIRFAMFVCRSFRPRSTTRFSLDRFSRNSLCIFRKSVVKRLIVLGQEYAGSLHEVRYDFLIQAQFFLKWEMFQIDDFEKIKIYFMLYDIFSKVKPFMR